MRVLLLGGTGEARALAAELVACDVEVTTSLAGRVSRPALPLGEVRIGGFGGTEGLIAHLRADAPDVLVDATHPFAASITDHAASAADATGTPLLVLRRRGWTAKRGDDWTWVPDILAAAARATASPPGTVFLTTGRRDLAAFAFDDTHHYLVRTVDPPAGAVPRRATLLLDRGPYELAIERALFQEHGVTLLVTKDSGGPMTAAKLQAARSLHVPVVVVERPPLPAGVHTVPDVDAALAWVLARLDR